MRLAIAVVALLTIGAAAPREPARLDWLEGRWMTSSGRWPIEAAEISWDLRHGRARRTAYDFPVEQTNMSWETDAHGRLSGKGTTIFAGDRRLKQTMQIRFKRGIAFLRISVDGSREAEFREVTHGPRGIVFENRSRGYPQRIGYWLEKGELMVETATLDGKLRRLRSYGRLGHY